MLNNAYAAPNSTVTVNTNNGLLFNTNSGAITTLNVGGLSGSGNISLADGSYAVMLSAGGNGSGTTYSGMFCGPGGLIKAGSGMLTLSGSNTYSGLTTISAGTISLNNTNAAPNSTVSVNSNNSLIFKTNSGAITTFNVGGLAGGGNIDLADGSHALTLCAGGNGASTMYSAALSGSGGLTKAGGGSLDLCGSNTYTGKTTIAAGTLDIDFSQSGSPMANIINNAKNTSALVLGGGTLAIQGTLSTTATNSQRFNGLAVNRGTSAIVLTSTSSNPLLLSLGSISRSPGGTVDFTLPSGTPSGSNGITISTANSNGIIGGYATVSGPIGPFPTARRAPLLLTAPTPAAISAR